RPALQETRARNRFCGDGHALPLCVAGQRARARERDGPCGRRIDNRHHRGRRPRTLRPRELRAMTTGQPGETSETLWDDGELVLSRARHPGDRPALSVRLAAATPTEASIARLEHAHAIRGELDPSWAARPTDLIGARGRLALRLEDPGGQVLAALLGKPWDVGHFLRTAAGVARALGGLHRRGLVHKDVKSSNILVDVATGEAWL